MSAACPGCDGGAGGDGWALCVACFARCAEAYDGHEARCGCVSCGVLDRARAALGRHALREELLGRVVTRG